MSTELPFHYPVFGLGTGSSYCQMVTICHWHVNLNGAWVSKRKTEQKNWFWVKLEQNAWQMVADQILVSSKIQQRTKTQASGDSQTLRNAENAWKFISSFLQVEWDRLPERGTTESEDSVYMTGRYPRMDLSDLHKDILPDIVMNAVSKWLKLTKTYAPLRTKISAPI